MFLRKVLAILVVKLHYFCKFYTGEEGRQVNNIVMISKKDSTKLKISWPRRKGYCTCGHNMVKVYYFFFLLCSPPPPKKKTQQKIKNKNRENPKKQNRLAVHAIARIMRKHGSSKDPWTRGLVLRLCYTVKVRSFFLFSFWHLSLESMHTVYSYD